MTRRERFILTLLGHSMLMMVAGIIGGRGSVWYPLPIIIASWTAYILLGYGEGKGKDD